MRKPLRFRTKKKRVSFLRRRFFWYVVGAASFSALLFYIILFSSFLKVQSVEIQGAREIAPEHILSTVQDNLWQSFFSIPQNSILLLNTKSLEEKLSFLFPSIRSVSLKRSFPETLVVTVEEREQIGTWCPSGDIDEDICFAIDKEGVPFKEVSNVSDYVVFSSQGELTLGTQLLDPSLLLALLNFREGFLESGKFFQLFIAAFLLGENGEVQGATKEGWRILLDLKENMEWQQTKLQTVIEQKIPLERRGDLEYIDIRFGDQAYIKYSD